MPYLNLLFAFMASASIAVAFRAPLRAVPASGLAGLLGYGAYALSHFYGAPQMLSVFLGALLVSAGGELMARLLREPATMFVVPGLFPLMPGLMVYSGMLNLARGELSLAGQELTRTLFYAGALAAGLALPPAFARRPR